MTHGSLFSGIGGFELGAQWALIPTLWNCEIEPHNREVLKRHFPDTYQYTDITTMETPPYVDIISGGFPCQDISFANVSNKKIYGTNNVGINGERSSLWREMWRICRDVRPRYILIENVAALAFRGLEYVLCDLAQIGYDAQWQTIHAEAFGYPHRRKRLFIAAYPSHTRRTLWSAPFFRSLQEVFPEKAPAKAPISLPLKRYGRDTDYSDVQLRDGFSAQLVKRPIEQFGNAVIPEIAYYLFECVKHHRELTE